MRYSKNELLWSQKAFHETINSKQSNHMYSMKKLGTGQAQGGHFGPVFHFRECVNGRQRSVGVIRTYRFFLHIVEFFARELSIHSCIFVPSHRID